MSWKESLEQKLSSYLETEFNYIETQDVNDASKIDLGCSGIYMEATVLFFAIKNLDFILKEHGRRKVAQIYTMFKELLTTMAGQKGGFINCYSPNTFLIIYPGREENQPMAVKNAMQITHALTEEFKRYFTDIRGLEFSMGLDHGHIMGTKNVSDNGIEQLSWYGSCIYKAMRISKECSRPYYVGISRTLYHSLDQDMRNVQRRILGIKKNIEVWTRVSYQFENNKKHLYQTNLKFELDDE